METNTDFNVEPPFCSMGCGFYGVREHHNLCSKCYAAFLRDQIAKSVANAAMGQPSNLASGVAVSSYDLAALMGELILAPIATKTKKKNRCTLCNKRVGLLGFECRCGDMFCGTHQYPEEHDCDVDFKRVGRRRLSKENPLCKADKMDFRI